MRISGLRREVERALREFAWGQWAQMGVLAAGEREDRWAADPEALLLFTFEVGRGEARLFDEALDWLATNERLVSVQRLRNLAHDDEDRALLEASLGWVARLRPRARLVAKRTGSPAQSRPGDAEPLFRGTRIAVRKPDEAFLRQGLLKAQIEPSRKSQAPDVYAPINFAFRMRQLLGMGARAEVARVLLCSGAPRLPVHDVAGLAGYAKRNVQEALNALHGAGVVDAMAVANEQQYGVPRERWAALLALETDQLPVGRDWPRLLRALRRLLRWLNDPRHSELSNYMRASEARHLMDELAPDLRLAGIPVPESRAKGPDYWPDFVRTVRATLAAVS